MSSSDKLAALYEADFLAWTRDQATVLRRMAEAGGHGCLDLEHLAEEIESAGEIRCDFVRSGVRRIIANLLELEFSSSLSARFEWTDATLHDHPEVEDRLTPTMLEELRADLDRLYLQARRKAGNSLRNEGERPNLPNTCPYSLEQIIAFDWFPANRHGIDDEAE